MKTYLNIFYLILLIIFLSGCCINKYTKIYSDGSKQYGTEYKFLFINID